MAKEHKYHRSHIEIDTALSQDRALELVRQALATRKGLVLDEQDGKRIVVVLKNAFGFPLLHFDVTATQSGSCTRLTTSLLDYKTSQMTYLYFIPMGPKTIEGYGEYRRFMNALQEVFAAADPSARSAVIERDTVTA